jgi:hypothetical protein
MKQILLTSILLFSIQLFSQRSSISPTIRKLKNDTIIWRVDSLLKKEDFKAKPKSNGPLGYSAIGIFLYPGENNGELLFYVEALFVKSKSFIVKFSDYVLKHEQIHFNICELYARKLRKEILETNFKKVKNVDKEISKIYKDIDQEHLKAQFKYDSETEHGLNSAKQKVWEDKIEKELLELEKYIAIEINPVRK